MRKTVFVLLATIALHLESAEIFVNNRSGKDSNDGLSAGNAVASFAAAMKLARPGDSLNIANTGTPYYESLIIRGNMGKDGLDFTVEGNGSVISGLIPLETDKFIPQDKGFFFLYGKKNSNVKPQLFHDGKLLPEAAKPDSTKPGEFCRTGDGFFFVPETGKSIKDYRLQGSLRDSGVVFLRASNVMVRNLISEHNANDGFNLHGSCHGITAENITGRFNGDDGFSAHEDVEVQIRNSSFHGNSYGIEDVNASVSSYRNVTVSDNKTGVHFSGGIHQLINCRITNNAIQVQVDSGNPAAYMGTVKEPAIFNGICFIKNTRITGAGVSLRISSRSSVSLIGSELYSDNIALDLHQDSEVFLLGSVVHGALPLQMNKARLFGDKNLFYPEKFKIDDTETDLAGLRKSTQSNADSFCEKPDFSNGILRQQPFMQKSPSLFLGPSL